MPIEKKVLKTFKSIPTIVESYLKSIPEALYDRKRSEEAWTIKEHILHLVNVQEMLLGRMETIIKEADPKIEPFFPDKEKDQNPKVKSLEEALTDYKDYRKKQVSLIKGLDDATLDKTADHKEYIKYTIRLMVSHMIFHEYWHMYRIEELWLTKDEFFK